MEGPTLLAFPHCPGALVVGSDLDRPVAATALLRGYPAIGCIYQAVRDSGILNYRGCRIPVPSGLNNKAWRAREPLLVDKSLVDMLAYGFPVGYEGDARPREHTPTHFLGKERGLDAMLGPFTEAPFEGWARYNPMMSCPKRDSTVRHVILGLSYPVGHSVKSGIPSGRLDRASFKLRLPNPWDLADSILQCSKWALVYKADLSRAYRQLRSCPGDWPLLMLKWKDKVFVDVAVLFGLRHGASACQCMTEAAAETVKEEVGARVHPYIDDTSGAVVPESAHGHYKHFLSCMSDLGLDAALGKCTAPRQLLCYGLVLFSTPSHLPCTSNQGGLTRLWICAGRYCLRVDLLGQNFKSSTGFHF